MFKYILIVISILLFVGCDNTKKIQKIIYTSDIHVSLPKGRFNYMTQKYINLLNKYKMQNNIYFINGDFIDKAYFKDGKIIGGNRDYQIKETKYFLNLTKELTSFKKNKILLNFGVGHDFGDLLLSEMLTQQKRIGRYKWGNIDLIWFTSQQATFPSNNSIKSHCLSNSEYKLLEDMLVASDNAILFSHIPLRTTQTFTYGKWANNRNLTIPLSDPLYKIIDQNKNKILAIFSGHIHTTYESKYKSIPIYSFPFMHYESFCEIEQNKFSIKISPKQLGLQKLNFKSKIYYLKNKFIYLRR